MPDRRRVSVMGKLWVRMTEIYGHQWASQYGSEVLDTWVRGLAHLAEQQIAIGIEQCVLGRHGEKWPPNLQQFVALCVDDYGSELPTKDRAWDEAVRASTDPLKFRFSHEIVRVCGGHVGWYDIRGGIPNTQVLKRRFAEEYAQLAAKHAAGRPLSEPVALIEHEGATLTPDQADRAAERLLARRMELQGLAGKTPQQLREEMRERLGRGKARTDQEVIKGGMGED